jgi:hypothetical protein
LLSPNVLFIVSQLDGEVEEIGNGSSHKRLRIAKYYVEVISHAEENKEPVATPLASGGFFRPHGTSHQAGSKSRFNMELVVSTFERAGLTKTALEEIGQKRLTAKAEASSSHPQRPDSSSAII